MHHQNVYTIRVLYIYAFLHTNSIKIWHTEWLTHFRCYPLLSDLSVHSEDANREDMPILWHNPNLT